MDRPLAPPYNLHALKNYEFKKGKKRSSVSIFQVIKKKPVGKGGHLYDIVTKKIYVVLPVNF